jgi:hypothetical protein
MHRLHDGKDQFNKRWLSTSSRLVASAKANRLILLRQRGRFRRLDAPGSLELFEGIADGGFGPTGAIRNLTAISISFH